MTAVEFIEQQIKWRTNMVDIIAEAKEMEADQIMDAYDSGRSSEMNLMWAEKISTSAEDYYNKTYKNENN